jgi:hypothetical protein
MGLGKRVCERREAARPRRGYMEEDLEEGGRPQGGGREGIQVGGTQGEGRRGEEDLGEEGREDLGREEDLVGTSGEIFSSPKIKDMLSMAIGNWKLAAELLPEGIILDMFKNMITSTFLDIDLTCQLLKARDLFFSRFFT